MIPQTFSNSNLEEFRNSPSYEVIHETRGRVRLRIPDLQDPEYAVFVGRSLKASPGVKDVSLNPMLQSITVHYAHHQSQEAFQDHLAIALHRANTLAAAPHTTTVLARRLGVAFQALNWRRSQVNFAEWSQERDPDGWSWRYDSGSKLFYPVLPSGEAIAPVSSKGERILAALGGAASGRMGGVVGKVAGEVLGMVLLGSVGMVIGAEVGTIVGEIVGSELGSFS